MSYDDKMEKGQKVLYISLAASFSVLAAASVCKIGLIVHDYQETTRTKTTLNETIKEKNEFDEFSSQYTLLKWDEKTDETTATIYGQGTKNGVVENFGFEYSMESQEDKSKYSNLLVLSKSDEHLDYTEDYAYKYINELITLVNEGTLIDSFKLTDKQQQKLNQQINKALQVNAKQQQTINLQEEEELLNY